MKFKQGDVCKAEERVIGHGVNTRGVMGRGVALALKEAFPGLLVAYQAALKAGSLSEGGCFLYEAGEKVIANLATQSLPGAFARTTWLKASLQALCKQLPEEKVFAIPRICSGIGGLLWKDVERILKQIEEEFQVEFFIYDNGGRVV